MTTVKEMLEIINDVEKFLAIEEITVKRIQGFGKDIFLHTEEVDYNCPTFRNFHNSLKQLFECNVSHPYAIKILNNYYAWAKNAKSEQQQALQNMKPFIQSDNAIDWLIENKFRIQYPSFSKNATLENIEKIKELMPNGSALHMRLKNVADTAFPSPRGFRYDYLVKVVAGFSTMWK